MMELPLGLLVFAVLLAMRLSSSLRILREDERGVVFQLGRFWKVIHAEGELKASVKLSAAAEILGRRPQALVLRTLETLTVIAANQGATIVLPLPTDLLTSLLHAARAREPG